jgi:hypothetical protein
LITYMTFRAFRHSSTRCSAFLLSLLSPVWRAKLCRPFTTQGSRTLDLEPGDAAIFPKLLALGCGQPAAARSFCELLEIGRMADLYGMTNVCREVEWQAERHLTVDRAAEVLGRAIDGGLARVRAASRMLALSQFESFAATAGFMGLEEQELGAMLDEGCVEAEGEEQVLEAVARWMRGGGAEQQLRGEGLLRRIRFDAIGTEYLRGAGRVVLPGSTLLGELMEAALARRSMGGAGEGRQEASRGPVGIRWGQHARTGQSTADWSLKVGQYFGKITGVAVCRVRGVDYACWGTLTGSIVVTRRERAALEIVKTLSAEKYVALHLAAWKGLIASASGTGVLRVWDVEQGKEVHTVQAPEGRHVKVLVVCGDGELLASGSLDRKVSLWSAGTEAYSLALLRTRVFQQDVRCMVSLGRACLAVGCADGVVVWDIRTDDDSADSRLGVCSPNSQFVISIDEGLQALATDGRLLVGTDRRKIEVWAVGEGRGVLVQAVDAYAADSLHRVQSLAIHAGKLITGSRVRGSQMACEVCVRDVTTLQLEHVLGSNSAHFSWHNGIRPATTTEAVVLLAERGHVWGGLDEHAVMWGYDGIETAAAAAAAEIVADDQGAGRPAADSEGAAMRPAGAESESTRHTRRRLVSACAMCLCSCM